MSKFFGMAALSWFLKTSGARRFPRLLTAMIISIAFAAVCGTQNSSACGQTPAELVAPKLASPQIFEGHDEYIYTVSLSPDGRTMVSAAGDNRAIIWDIARGKVRHELPHDAAVYAAAVSPNGLLIATATGEGKVALWNVATGKRINQQKKHRDAVYAIAFSPDGKMLTSVGGSTDGGDTTGRVWQVDGLKLTKELTGHKRQVYGVAYSPDGQTLATGCSDKTIRLWNVKTGEFSTLRGHTSDVYRVKFSPDGTKLASVSQDGTVRLWMLRTGKSKIVFEGKRKEPMYGVAFSEDGFWLGATGDDYHVRLWRTSDLKLTVDEKVSRKSLYAITISPDQKHFFVAGEDGDIRQYPTPDR